MARQATSRAQLKNKASCHAHTHARSRGISLECFAACGHIHKYELITANSRAANFVVDNPMQLADDDRDAMEIER